MESLLDNSLYAYILGFFIVFLYGVRSFNEPNYSFEIKVDNDGAEDIDHFISINEASPSKISGIGFYNSLRVVYIVWLLILFFIISKILGALFGGRAILDVSPNEPSRIILSALIISGFIEQVPYINKSILEVKLYLHQLARIPTKARDIFQLIKTSNIRGEELNKVASVIRYDDEDFRDSVGRNDFITLYNRYQYLCLLGKISGIDVYKSNANVLGVLTRKGVLEKKVKSYKCSDEINYQKLNVQLVAELKILYSALTSYLVRSASSSKQMNNKMVSLGFEVNNVISTKIPFSSILKHALVLSISVLVTSFFLVVLSKKIWGDIPNILLSMGISDEYEAAFTWFLYSLFLYLTAIFMTYHLRNKYIRDGRWGRPKYDNGLSFSRNISRYVLISTASWFACALVLLCTSSLLSHTPITEKSFVVVGLWAMIPAGMSLLMCYRFDTYIGLNTSSNFRAKIFGALGQAIVLALICFIVMLMMERFDLLVEHQIYLPQDYFLLIVTSALAGSTNSLFMRVRSLNRRDSPRKTPPLNFETVAVSTFYYNAISFEADVVDVSKGGMKVSVPPDNIEKFKENQAVKLKNLSKEHAETSAIVRNIDYMHCLLGLEFSGEKSNDLAF
ncbi:hypothetical protein F9L16_10855 [Agarivorans sp. B2Z047]|uniref:PilZ domain-containing protein n=1 Tax=Agarivorans sp. B2Z047 TaxID=2652721 RepID=UPI00128E8A6C|nr:PilZ domain-containing protein [Agarivorans sp. B2Z047]MPW29497.1 hypothetical protein [Agarivorans sp. B2Z047]UQN45085.1 PilZ domain-containing protein [Agarivorans sp. B2Z047]